jgi:hypothetical protein
MSLISRRGVSLPPANDAQAEGTVDAWVSTAVGAGGHWAPGSQTKAPSTVVPASERTRRCARSPATRERLHRLRRELSLISPPPECAEKARTEIIAALARAGLQAWSLPTLDAAAARHADGSVRLDLLSHAVLINPWGAFRIVDLHAQAAAYFEMRGRCGRGFAVPP